MFSWWLHSPPPSLLDLRWCHLHRTDLNSSETKPKQTLIVVWNDVFYILLYSLKMLFKDFIQATFSENVSKFVPQDFLSFIWSHKTLTTGNHKVFQDLEAFRGLRPLDAVTSKWPVLAHLVCLPDDPGLVSTTWKTNLAKEKMSVGPLSLNTNIIRG